MSKDDFNFSGRDWRDLTPQQWTEARREIVCRSHQMRSQALRELASYVCGALAGTLRMIGARYARLRQAHAERQAIAGLQALDDHTLKDIGIRRSEIESVVHTDRCDMTRRRCNCTLAA